MTESPTAATASEWQRAYDFFNRELFDRRLPNCLITLRGGKRCHGYFSPTRFADVRSSGDEPTTVDEIAMNPRSLATRPVVDNLSTLVHEMTHLEQQHFGEPPRKGYHDREWAGLMKRVGLQPSDTAAPGGKETGQRVSHYIVAGGPFERAAQALTAEGFEITWGEAAASTGTKAGKRAKYVCPTCKLKAWAKHEASLMCGDCGDEMEAA